MAEPVVDLSTPRAIHLVGIGGAGISAIGIILAAMGHQVTGSDTNRTGAWPKLEAAGVRPEVVEPGDLFAVAAAHYAQVVAHSTAFQPTAEVLAAATAAGQQLVDRAAILAAICSARPTVAVSGTHGKTSTTAMLATLLDGVGADPSFLVGAVPVGLGDAARWGGATGSFVVEADESDGSFLELGAATAVVTNVDEDHLDHWGTIDHIEAGFDRFLAEAATGIVCIDDPRVAVGVDERALRLATAHGSVTVGESAEARYRIHDVAIDHLTTTFGLTVDGVEVGPVAIGTPGRHHARNAAVAIATAATLGVPVADGVAALSAYAGVARRFQVVGEAGGVTVVDDYAHNPGKVRALVASAAEAGWGRVVVVFQPHRYTRTRDQGEDFGAALALGDVVAVTDVYGAGEAPLPGVSGRTLVDAVLDRRPWAEVAWVPTLDDAAAWASQVLRPGDLCLTVGAGDVSTLGPRLVAALAAAAPA
ncbi:UDP-N-acetylmuramate--L-alanine ligase [Aquihabitans sp. G128]|uniref:UDP-N-acetylmuramate--L-alanine ligase n=1 Tax=Aquihabitans sp. G128 TaxID=2849779 RepID=UPI001C22D373|nr:UDP-N-acetylmuramate--L-alanine ligase [Aquihabitans sp. G128]QXC62270.1 UDP-N-acetylmuramate--L-alanine ligase [Aquihabitans sp. G128]